MASLLSAPPQQAPAVGAGVFTSVWLNWFSALYTRVVGKIYSNVAATGTAATALTLPTGVLATYRITATLDGVTNDVTDYSAFSIIMTDGTTARIALGSNGAKLTITLSGLAVQVTQSSGAQKTIITTVARIA